MDTESSQESLRLPILFFFLGLLLLVFVCVFTWGAILALLLPPVLWFLAAPLWLRHRDFAASFYLPLWIGLVWLVVVELRRNGIELAFPNKGFTFGNLIFVCMYAVILLAPIGLVLSAKPIFQGLREASLRRMWPVVVAPVLIVVCWQIQRKFETTYKLSTHMMKWTTDGDAFARVTGAHIPIERLRSTVASQVNDESLTYLYRQVGSGYCVQPVFSDRFREFLQSERQQTVAVTYQLTLHMGSYSGYSLYSIDRYRFQDKEKTFDLGAGQPFAVGDLSQNIDCVR